MEEFSPRSPVAEREISANIGTLQPDVVAQLVDDLVVTFGVRRDAGFLALDVGDFVAEAGG